MKSLMLLILSVFAVTAAADIDVKTRSASAWVTGQDAQDLVTFLHSSGIKGYTDNFGYEILTFSASVKFDKVTCGQKTLSFSGGTHISMPERWEQDDRPYNADVITDLNAGSEQCQPNSGAEKFLRYMEKFGAKALEPSVIDFLGFSVNCETGAPAGQPARQTCSVDMGA